MRKNNLPRVNLTPFLRKDTSVLCLSGSVRYLLSLTQWKQREQEQNGGGVNHLPPIMQLPTFVNIETFFEFSVII